MTEERAFLFDIDDNGPCPQYNQYGILQDAAHNNAEKSYIRLSQ